MLRPQLNSPNCWKYLTMSYITMVYSYNSPLFEKQDKRHQTTGILWDLIGYLQSTLASKWLASNISCVFKSNKWVAWYPMGHYWVLINHLRLPPWDSNSHHSSWVLVVVGGSVRHMAWSIPYPSLNGIVNPLLKKRNLEEDLMMCLWKLNYVDAD